MKIKKLPQPFRKRGFTLIELLVVIMIIGVLAGLSFGALTAVKKLGEKTKAKNDVAQIKMAVANYFNDYNKYPIPKAGSDVDLETDRSFMAVLMGEDKELNPRENNYIQPKPANSAGKGGMVSPGGGIGEYVDPWGQPFQLRIDGDYDERLKNPNTGSQTKQIFAGVAVWSSGPDQDGKGEMGASGSTDLWKDSITSWE